MPKKSSPIVGIYKIESDDGRVYIGSSRDIGWRWYTHRYELDRCTHNNRFLQSAWSKHGAEFFCFSVLETLPDDGELFHYEQIWLDILWDSLDRTDIYNLARYAGKAKQPSSTYEFQDYNDAYMATNNLPKFCRDNNLDYGLLAAVLGGYGVAKSHKGYKRLPMSDSYDRAVDLWNGGATKLNITDGQIYEFDSFNSLVNFLNTYSDFIEIDPSSNEMYFTSHHKEQEWLNDTGTE